jgi:hypothetical protein
MVARIWHGWTTPENSVEFENILGSKVFPEFEKGLPGYKGGQLLKSALKGEVEFTTILWFDSIASVEKFAGHDYETAHIDPLLQKLLLRYDVKSVHKEVSYSTF